MLPAALRMIFPPSQEKAADRERRGNRQQDIPAPQEKTSSAAFSAIRPAIPPRKRAAADRRETEKQSLIRLVEQGVGLHIAIQTKKLTLLIAIERNQRDHGSIIGAGRKRRHGKAHAELMAHSLISVA